MVSMRGVVMLEFLIAGALLALTLTAFVSATFGNQAASIDVAAASEALMYASADIEAMRAVARATFRVASTTATRAEASGPLTFERKMAVRDASPCMKELVSETRVLTDPLRPQAFGFSTYMGNAEMMDALGGDCETRVPQDDWDGAATFASDASISGTTHTLDVLDGMAYMGFDTPPYLAIADLSDAAQGVTDGLFLDYANGFDAGGTALARVNDIDVARIDGHTYAFLALASTTAQFAIVDVTDPRNPQLLALRALPGVTATDTTGWGWRLQYHDERVYFVARETAGPELHTFSVSDPAHPFVLASREITTTVNGLVARDGFLFLAAETDARGEFLVFDVSVPAALTEIVGARTNLPGNQNGASLFLTGTTLYAGRENVSGGPELYVLDAYDPRRATSGLPILGTPKEVGGEVRDLFAAGPLLFLASSRTSDGLQVWDISSPASLVRLFARSTDTIVGGGLDYESDRLYAATAATPHLRMLWDPE